MQNYHNKDILPVWQATASDATTDTAEFFDLSHEVLARCSMIFPPRTSLTLVMHAIIGRELENAYYESFSAYYLSSVRGLRFVFEFASQVALLEKRYEDLPDDDRTKFEQAFDDEEFKRFRFPMIDRLTSSLTLNNAECETLKALYGDLSVKGTHANPAFLSNQKLNNLMFGQFDATLYADCKEMCRKVVDFVVVVLFAKYPAMRNDGKLKELATDLGLSMTMARMP
jgi:hypothetical protein